MTKQPKEPDSLDGYILEPINERVLVQRDKPKETVSKGGVIASAGWHYDVRGEVVEDAPPVTGTVLAVGPGVLDEGGIFRATTVKAGNRILFGKHAGSNIEMPDGSEVLMMRESDILGVFKKKK